MSSFESFNVAFCESLEFHLTHLLSIMEHSLVKGFWCDGVLMPPDKLNISKKRINDTRKIETKAWIGRGGEIQFKLITHLGKKSLRKYAKGKQLNDCIPTEQEKSLKIDLDNKLIELYLK